MALHLVTGGSGYFGSILVHMLHKKGLAVRIFDLNDADDRPKDVEFVQGDIRNQEAIENACRNVDVIYHAVAQVPLAKQKKLFFSVNVNGADNLFKAALKNNVRKIIHISSSAVFGIPSKNPVDETVKPRPMELYGQAKYEAEKLASKYVNEGLDITIIRPRTILGHGRLGIFSILFSWVREGVNIPVLGGGNNRYQFVHAEDLASACILASAKQGASTYNIGAERFGTMRELLEDLIKHANSSSKVKSIPMSLAIFFMRITSAVGLSPLGDYHSLMYGREMFFDLTKPIKELNWKPHYSNTEMICESYDWFCKNYNEIQHLEKNMPMHRKPAKEGILKLVKWLLK